MPPVDLSVEPFKNYLPQDQADKWAVCRSSKVFSSVPLELPGSLCHVSDPASEECEFVKGGDQHALKSLTYDEDLCDSTVNQSTGIGGEALDRNALFNTGELISQSIERSHPKHRYCQTSNLNAQRKYSNFRHPTGWAWAASNRIYI